MSWTRNGVSCSCKKTYGAPSILLATVPSVSAGEFPVPKPFAQAIQHVFMTGWSVRELTSVLVLPLFLTSYLLGSWCIYIYLSSLPSWVNNSKTCILHYLSKFLHVWVLIASVGWFNDSHFSGSLPFLVLGPHSSARVSSSSHVNHLHLNPCLKIFFWGNPNQISKKLVNKQ